jgi:hypothetical protein
MQDPVDRFKAEELDAYDISHRYVFAPAGWKAAISCRLMVSMLERLGEELTREEERRQGMRMPRCETEVRDPPGFPN